MTTTIYLDYNATTPHDPAVIEAMLPYLHTHFGNPSSGHAYGRHTKQAVSQAREQIAGMIGALPDEIIFTGSGTEANNMLIKGIAEAHPEGGHVITSAIEHPAILEPCQWLAGRGYDLTILPVNNLGQVNPAAVIAAIRDDTILISIMLANNEVGTLQPVAEICALAHERGIMVHTDAAQGIGKIPVDVESLGVDFLSIAGHKLYAPKGIGALYIRQGRSLPIWMHGASHESGRRAGTENVLEIVGLGMAAQLITQNLENYISHMQKMRNRLWQRLDANLEEIQRNGHPSDSLPNTLSVSFKHIEANQLVAMIGERVAASAGAACHADQIDISAVLQAMRVPVEYAMGTLRLTTGRFTSAEEIDQAADIIIQAVERLHA